MSMNNKRKVEKAKKRRKAFEKRKNVNNVIARRMVKTGKIERIMEAPKSRKFRPSKKKQTANV